MTPAAPGVKPSAGTSDPEEAGRLLAEKRRQAREQREREEQQRLEQEHRNRIQREEGMLREAEERRRREEEARVMAEEQRLRDEAQRAQEEREEQEESHRLQRQREEAESRAREEAERQRLEREKHFQKEEQERLERKKRLEEIMKRTRKSDAGEKKEVRSPAQVNGKDPGPDTESSKGPAIQQNPLESLNSSAADVNQSQGGSGPVLNGVQPANHQNGLSAKAGEAADFDKIIQQSEPLLAFEGGEPFLRKSSPMKPQHVAEVL